MQPGDETERQRLNGTLFAENRGERLQCPVRKLRRIFPGRPSLGIELRSQHAEETVIEIAAAVADLAVQRFDHVEA